VKEDSRLWCSSTVKHATTVGTEARPLQQMFVIGGWEGPSRRRPFCVTGYNSRRRELRMATFWAYERTSTSTMTDSTRDKIRPIISHHITTVEALTLTVVTIFFTIESSLSARMNHQMHLMMPESNQSCPSDLSSNKSQRSLETNRDQKQESIVHPILS
jgi:hypothetical protein